MVNHSARRDTDERAAEVQRLLKDARSEPLDIDADELPEDPQLAAMLGALPASAFGDAVAAAADELLAGGEAMTVSTRQLLIEGAERGARWRRNMNGTLTRALRAKREQDGLPLSEVGAATGLDAGLVRDIELGASPLRDLAPHAVAAWIRAVELDRSTALQALHRTLTPAPAAGRGVYAAASTPPPMAGEAREYYDAVAVELKGGA